MRNVLIIESSPRKNGNTNLLCEEFRRGAEDNGHKVEIVNLNDKTIDFCKACGTCQKNGGLCVIKDDMAEILQKFQNADVLVLATPVYFYGISAQMKTFIDRTYPIWQCYTPKDVYYIVAAGLGQEIRERSLGDLDGFVDHLPDSCIKGRIYGTDVMAAGMVKEMPVMKEVYQMGRNI